MEQASKHCTLLKMRSGVTSVLQLSNTGTAESLRGKNQLFDYTAMRSVTKGILEVGEIENCVLGMLSIVVWRRASLRLCTSNSSVVRANAYLKHDGIVVSSAKLLLRWLERWRQPTHRSHGRITFRLVLQLFPTHATASSPHLHCLH